MRNRKPQPTLRYAKPKRKPKPKLWNAEPKLKAKPKRKPRAKPKVS